MKIEQKVSVIIPTLNRNRLLERCLRSLLIQTSLPDEIIIVDNSKTGLAKNLVNKIIKNTSVNVKYLIEPKKGVSRARNRGIKEACYPILAFIDDDCVAKENWINIIKKFFSYPRVNVAFGKNLNGNLKNLFTCLEHYACEVFFLTYLYQNGSAWKSSILDTKNLAIRKSFFIRHHLRFDTKLTMLVDVDLGLQIKKASGDIYFEPQMTVCHYGRTNFINHLQREFHRLHSNYIFQKKWKMNTLSSQNKSLVLAQKIKQIKENKIRKKVEKEILDKKSRSFKLFFFLLVFLDRLIFFIGYKYVAIKNRSRL